MEYTEQRDSESTLERRIEIAEGIYNEIVNSLKRLQALPEIDETHSSVIELTGERNIALRALQNLKEMELLAEAA